LTVITITRGRRLLGALGAGLLALALSSSVAFAANGNNGTVKTQDGSTAADPITENEAQVCTFHFVFLFADAGQSGSWQVDQIAPTGDAPAIISGTYATDATGQYTTVEYGLPIGHYSLSWEGQDGKNDKHKSFWVNCENAPGPIGGIG